MSKEPLEGLMRLMVVAAIVLLPGCVTPTDIVAVGNGAFMLGVNARGGFVSNNTLINQNIQRANAFCNGQGKVAEIESATAEGVQGWTPQDSQVTFRCVAGTE